MSDLLSAADVFILPSALRTSGSLAAGGNAERAEPWHSITDNAITHIGATLSGKASRPPATLINTPKKNRCINHA